MFELTQYALRSTELDDLPAEQYTRYRALAAEVLRAAEAHLGIRWTIALPELARLVVTITDGVVRVTTTTSARTVFLSLVGISELSASGEATAVLER